MAIPKIPYVAVTGKQTKKIVLLLFVTYQYE